MDPDNRRRLPLRLTQKGREQLGARIAGGTALRKKLERMAHSELRALERALSRYWSAAGSPLPSLPSELPY